MTSPAVC